MTMSLYFLASAERYLVFWESLTIRKIICMSRRHYLDPALPLNDRVNIARETLYGRLISLNCKREWSSHEYYLLCRIANPMQA